MVTSKKDVDFQDAYYSMIQTNMNKIPNLKVQDFFNYLMIRQSSFNDQGFFKKHTLAKAMDEFMGELSKQIWKDNNIIENSILIYDKLRQLYEHYRIEQMYQTELIEFLKVIKLDKFIRIDKNRNKIPLFTDTELEVINSAGLENIFNRISKNSKQEVTEEIERHYKTIITGRYFKEDRVDNTIEHTVFKLPEPQRF